MVGMGKWQTKQCIEHSVVSKIITSSIVMRNLVIFLYLGCSASNGAALKKHILQSHVSKEHQFLQDLRRKNPDTVYFERDKSSEIYYLTGADLFPDYVSSENVSVMGMNNLIRCVLKASTFLYSFAVTQLLDQPFQRSLVIVNTRI